MKITVKCCILPQKRDSNSQTFQYFDIDSYGIDRVRFGSQSGTTLLCTRHCRSNFRRTPRSMSYEVRLGLSRTALPAYRASQDTHFPIIFVILEIRTTPALLKLSGAKTISLSFVSLAGVSTPHPSAPELPLINYVKSVQSILFHYPTTVTSIQHLVYRNIAYTRPHERQDSFRFQFRSHIQSALVPHDGNTANSPAYQLYRFASTRKYNQIQVNSGCGSEPAETHKAGLG
ncbi:unnamed protein product, partial [Rhizoctonia solani]